LPPFALLQECRPEAITELLYRVPEKFRALEKAAIADPPAFRRSNLATAEAVLFHRESKLPKAASR